MQAELSEDMLMEPEPRSTQAAPHLAQPFLLCSIAVTLFSVSSSCFLIQATDAFYLRERKKLRLCW